MGVSNVAPGPSTVAFVSRCVLRFARFLFFKFPGSPFGFNEGTRTEKGKEVLLWNLFCWIVSCKCMTICTVLLTVVNTATITTNIHT